MIFKVSYYIRSNYKNKEGKSSIMVRIYLNGEMCVVGSSGLSVNRSKWNAKFSRVKGRNSEALSLNLQIDNITASLHDNMKTMKILVWQKLKMFTLEILKKLILF